METSVGKRLTGYLAERVLPLGGPRALGKALRGSKWGEAWMYRVGNYRIIVRILDLEVVVVVLRAGDRKNVY
jgi:mRNA interferase RelE/StbE